jgi:hypothetical protein
MASQFTFDAIFNSLIETIEDTMPEKDVAVLCSLLRRAQNDICCEYVNVRDGAKEIYMKHTNRRLDRHKCAAAFMIAFLNKLDTGNNGRIVKNLVREKLAIVAGLTVLETFMEADELTKENLNFINCLKKNNGFVSPDVQCDNKPHSENWAMELYHARIEGKIFLPALAHELFFMEQYNRLFYKKHANSKKKLCNVGTKMGAVSKSV